MNTNEILSHIDSLLKESRLDEAEKYMKATLSDAEKSDRPDIMLTLYNELAGFYRDCGRFAEALESCRRSEVLLEKMNIGGAQLASALLNSANACRAAGLYDESFDYYRRIYAILENIGAEKPLYASYYNNLALLYQETNNWQEAADCLKKARRSKALERAFGAPIPDEVWQALEREMQEAPPVTAEGES